LKLKNHKLNYAERKEVIFNKQKLDCAERKNVILKKQKWVMQIKR
jgi:hypothetical protein